jgi:hypothetical protein
VAGFGFSGTFFSLAESLLAVRAGEGQRVVLVEIADGPGSVCS